MTDSELLEQAIVVLSYVADYAAIGLEEGLAIARDNRHYDEYEFGRAQGRKDECRLILALLRENEELARRIREEAVIPPALEERAKHSPYEKTEQALLTVARALQGECQEEVHHLGQMLLVMSREERIGRSINARVQMQRNRELGTQREMGGPRIQ